MSATLTTTGSDLNFPLQDVHRPPGLPMDRFVAARPGTLGTLTIFWLITLGLQLLFYTGPVASDDLNYLLVAREYRGGHPRDYQLGAAPPQIYARLAAWVPLRISTWVVGPGTGALLPMPLLAAGLSLVAVWILASRYLGSDMRWYAMAALGLSPYYLVYATIWQPDTLAGLFILLALIGLGPAVVYQTCGRPVLRSLIGGFVLGIGFSAKEPTLLVLPGLGVFVLLFRTRASWAWRRLAMASIGVGCFLAMEVGVLWAMTGDPLFHFHSIVEAAESNGPPIREGMLKYFLIEYLRWAMDPGGPYGWWGPAYVVAIAVALWKSPDIIRVGVCVILVMLVYLTAGTLDLRSYFPIVHQPRYLLPLFPLAAVPTAWAFRSLLRWGRTGRTIAMILALGLIGNTFWYANRNAGRQYEAATYACGRMLLDPSRQPWVGQGRLCASAQTVLRLWPIAEEEGLAPLDEITHAPSSPEEWLKRYERMYVLVSRADRAPYSPLLAVITSESRQALASFPMIASASPPKTRLSRIGALLGLWPETPDTETRIDVYHIYDGKRTDNSTLSTVNGDLPALVTRTTL